MKFWLTVSGLVIIAAVCAAEGEKFEMTQGQIVRHVRTVADARETKELNERVNEAFDWFLQQLKPLMVKYPVLQTETGWKRNERNMADEMISQWIGLEKNIGWIERGIGEDGTVAAVKRIPAVKQDGVHFYFYVADHPVKLESTRFATVKFGAKQAGAFYYFKTNPADSELEKAIDNLFVRTVRRIDADAVIQRLTPHSGTFTKPPGGRHSRQRPAALSACMISSAFGASG